MRGVKVRSDHQCHGPLGAAHHPARRDQRPMEDEPHGSGPVPRQQLQDPPDPHARRIGRGHPSVAGLLQVAVAKITPNDRRMGRGQVAMSDGWKLTLDLFNAFGTVLSVVAAWLSLKVLKRIEAIRGDMLLRGALPDLKKRMGGAQKNLKSAVDRKASTNEPIAELRALAQDLLSKVTGQKVADLTKLREATAVLIVALKENLNDTDRLDDVASNVTTVLALIASAERDQKTWSHSG